MPAETNGTDLQDKSLTSSNFNLKRTGSLPRIDKSRSCKTYRTPPTPPLEKQSDMEKDFKLDCIAVSNISLDYSRANPKMGTVIPPYNSLNDSSISEFVKSYGVKDFLKRNGMKENEHESMAGKVHDDFFKTGAGYRYLNLRNQFGNGHHPETVDGHQRYMAEQPRVMISYNNMNGYRRNIPKLRCEPPSTFSVDPRWYERVRKTYKNNFSEEELLEHFKNTYMIGYPFHDNNYNHFHPSVKYVITVKTGSNSLESYNGNVGINIVSRNFDTGFIKLDGNIACVAAKSLDYKPSKVKCSLFKRNQKDVFEFEDQDIRTISAIILSRDGKGDELLYLDYVNVEIQKSYEKNTYRFPFDGWLRMSRQDKKTELLKQRFGKRNSIIVYPNEVPKFEYRVKISPQITKNTEYTLDVCYEIKKIDATIDYKVEFSSDLPISGNLVIRLNGSFGRSETFKFNRFTRPDDREENDLLFTINSKDVGEIKSVSAFFDESEGRSRDYELTNFKINDNTGNVYEFEINQFIKSNKEIVIKSIFQNNDIDEDEYEEPPSNKGKLEVQLVGQTESTGQFELKNPIDSENGIHTYIKKEANIGNIKSVRVRFEGEKGYFAWVKSIKIKSNKNQEFSFVRNISIKNFEEIALRDNRKNPRTATAEQDINRQVFIQIFGDKKKSSLFQLKNASSDDDTLDVFSTTDNDLGKITNLFVKYQDKSDTKVQVDFVEVIDPRGNSYRFRAEVNLKGGRGIMLPRKSGPINEGSTTGTDLEGTATEIEGTLTEIDGTATEPDIAGTATEADITEEVVEHDKQQTNKKSEILEKKNESDAEEIPD